MDNKQREKLKEEIAQAVEKIKKATGLKDADKCQIKDIPGQSFEEAKRNALKCIEEANAKAKATADKGAKESKKLIDEANAKAKSTADKVAKRTKEIIDEADKAIRSK